MEPKTDPGHTTEALPDATKPQGYGEPFEEVVRARLARRAFLKGGAAAGVGMVVVPAVTAVAPRSAKTDEDPGARLRFSPIAASGADAVRVPEGYTHDVLIRWGDPLTASASAFTLSAQTPEAQRQQFGFNCDFVVDLPLPGWLAAEVKRFGRPSFVSSWFLGSLYASLRSQRASRALLWVNHEYTSGSEMFPGYDPNNPSADQVDIELAAHGGSIVEIVRDRAGRWGYDPASVFNRRITGETEIEIVGPLAGHALLQTSADPAGKTVRGMLNNCGGGFTPWGTILSAEENFDQYFANRSALAASDPQKAALYARLAAPAAASERKWERFHPRFDVSVEPNEYARFGYVVEVDPYDPTSTPRKHTAVGRFKHEAACTVLSKRRHAVLYSGDDARFEYIYKFVSTGKYDAFDRRANMRLLEEGTLYVAKLNADGSGQWLPLVHGQGPLTAANGFPSQAEVLVNTRGAADALGATKMDRPEDIEVSPVTNKVYIALTNNSARTSLATDPAEVAANPRLNNRWGHVVEFEEEGGDNAATQFRWELLIVCGDPAATPGTYFAGFDPALVSPISCPDNLDFDDAGNLWIATDGAPASPGFTTVNDGIYAVPVEGEARGYLRQFLSGVPGCEVACLKHAGDNRTLFASIQHPGEGAGLPNTLSSWPDGTNNPPRPAVVAVRHTQSRKIGL
jgi:secreted PhoX family phosphatase